MNYVFWNTNNKNHVKLILDIVSEYDIDVIILAEYPENGIANLIFELNKIQDFYSIPTVKNERIHFISKLKPSKIELLDENNYVRFVSFLDDDTKEVINLGLLHLSSKLCANELDMLIQINKINSMLEEIEKENNKSILIGDFNMNPFEIGMLSANGFHAFPRMIESNKISRSILGEEKKFFYNPMWKYLIKEDDPIGSYYYTSGGAYTLHWHVFDQILIRPQLINFLDTVELISTLTKSSFIKNNKPNKEISDHLPIFLKLGE